MKLYWIAAFYMPTKEEEEKGEQAKIILKPDVILAKDDQVAAMRATRLIPSEYEEKLDKVTMAVRPF